MAAGYVQKRRAILQHLQEGRMTLREYAVYDVLLLSADKATGIWWGGAPALVAKFGQGDMSLRIAREALHSLEEAGYIKRFFVQGQRGNHPIGINKYLVSFGVLSGKYLNTTRSAGYKTLVYDSGSEDVSVAVSETVSETVSDTVTYSKPETGDLKPEKKDRKKDDAVASEATGSKPVNPEIISQARELASTLFGLMGNPEELNQPAIVKKWYQQAKQALDGPSDYQSLTKAIKWAFSGEEQANWWRNTIVTAQWPMAMVAKSAEKIVMASSAAARKKPVTETKATTYAIPAKPAVKSQFLTATQEEDD